MSRVEWILIGVLAFAITVGVVTVLVWAGYIAPVLGLPAW